MGGWVGGSKAWWRQASMRWPTTQGSAYSWNIVRVSWEERGSNAGQEGMGWVVVGQ